MESNLLKFSNKFATYLHNYLILSRCPNTYGRQCMYILCFFTNSSWAIVELSNTIRAPILKNMISKSSRSVGRKNLPVVILHKNARRNWIPFHLHQELRRPLWWAHITFRSEQTFLHGLFIPFTTVRDFNANSILLEDFRPDARQTRRFEEIIPTKVELYSVWLNGQTELTWIISDYYGTVIAKYLQRLFLTE